MRQYGFLLSIVLTFAFAGLFLHASFAAPVDAGAAADALGTSPSVVVVPSLGDEGYADKVLDAARNARWLVLLALVVNALVAIARRPSVVGAFPLLGTRLGGMALGVACSLGSLLALQWYTGRLDWGIFVDGLLASLLATGQYHTTRNMVEASPGDA